jgi:hypothetical protein
LKKHHSIKMNTPLKQINMSTTAATQPIFTVVKDEFAKVITENTLSPSLNNGKLFTSLSNI